MTAHHSLGWMNQVEEVTSYKHLGENCRAGAKVISPGRALNKGPFVWFQSTIKKKIAASAIFVQNSVRVTDRGSYVFHRTSAERNWRLKAHRRKPPDRLLRPRQGAEDGVPPSCSFSRPPAGRARVSRGGVANTTCLMIAGSAAGFSFSRG